VEFSETSQDTTSQLELAILGYQFQRQVGQAQLSVIRELQEIVEDKSLPAQDRINAAKIILNLPSPGISISTFFEEEDS
jgi:hypothetical protein